MHSAFVFSPKLSLLLPSLATQLILQLKATINLRPCYTLWGKSHKC